MSGNEDIESNNLHVVDVDFSIFCRCLILDLASCIVEGCDTDLVNILFSLIKHYLQVS